MGTVVGPYTVALLYRRVSTDEQATEGVSMHAQQGDTRNYAAHRHWTISAEFADVLSGTRDDRPAYLKLLAHARRLRNKNRSVVVVVSRLDRFGRSVLERARCAEELRSLHIPIHSVNEGGLLPELVANLLAAVAEDEVRRIRERSAETRRFVIQVGWHYPTRAAWGYRRRLSTAAERAEGAPHTVLEPDPRRAQHVRKAFKRAAAGDSVSSIMIWIQSLSAEARGGRGMSYPLVRALLSRPVYVARHVSGDANVLSRPRMRWRPIVSDELWTSVQQKLSMRPRNVDSWKPKYLLAGLIRCGQCGGRMGGNRNQALRKAGYDVQPRYTCTGRVSGRGGRSAHCYETALMPAVDDCLIQAVSDLLSRDVNVSALERKKALSSADSTMIAEPALSRDRLLGLALRLVDGSIDAAEFQRSRRKLVRHRNSSEPGVAPSKNAPTTREQITSANRVTIAWAEALHQQNLDLQRAVLHQLIDEVQPIRRARATYTVRIRWRAFAIERFGALADHG